MNYIPPFKLTSLIFQKSLDISQELGIIKGQKLNQLPLSLRRTNNIKTIQASLAIEGNRLSIEQVADILDGKRVLGSSKDILEVKNALQLYENLSQFNPLNIEDLLKAHKILMSSLIDENGQWRNRGIGVFKGQEVVHVAPPAKKVSSLMQDLFDYLNKDQTYPWLLKACIFHYELEFIHPFADGNGRMGRLWQQLLLMREDRLFEFIPIEVLIKEHQKDYYQVLEDSDTLGESTPFVEFSLNIIHQALVDYSSNITSFVQDANLRLAYAKSHLTKEWFSRKDYISMHKNISSATANRDLLEGVQQNILIKKGEKNQMIYSFNNQN